MNSQVMLRCLEMTFGKIPKLIGEHIKYLTYNDADDDFTCVPCDKIIQKVNNKEHFTTNNFEKHLLSKMHKDNTVTNDELKRKLNTTFVGKIPQVVLNNFFALDVNGINYECAICDKIIVVSANLSVTENNFSYHLLSAGHEEKLETYREALSQLQDIYGGIPRFVLNHIHFLDTSGRHYICTICEKHIQVHPSDSNETEISFDKHLHSLKHMRNAKQAKAFSVIPELKQVFFHLPNYMLRSVEYININGPHFFCSLCNTNIKFIRHNVYETEQNFKLHISSSSHEENLRCRRDPDNETFSKLHSLFEEFPDHVLENLKYITVDDDDYLCSICNETIIDEENLTKDNLIFHFESFDHRCKVDVEMERRSELIGDLEDLFGSVPQLIEDNIEYFQFKGENNIECILCNKIMKFKNNGDTYECNTFITNKNFEQHLNSNKHREELDLIDDDDLITDLEKLFLPIPQFIMNNLYHLGHEQDSDDFYCFLCDKKIAIVNGNKKEELTKQNFRTHLFSVGHMAKLKHDANIEMEATEQLESVFNKIPTFIMSNIEHIEIQGSHFHCTLCDAQIMRGDAEITEQKFHEHLCGARHKSQLKREQENNDEALQRLDHSFWRVPEFLLRNIDFLDIWEDDLFCILCQETLPINEDDLENTKKCLRCHMDSEEHQSNLTNM